MVMRLNDLPTIAITFVVIGVVVSVGLAIQSDVGADLEADYGADSTAVNASDSAVEGTAELSDKLPLIGLVVAFSVLLGILGEFLFGNVGR